MKIEGRSTGRGAYTSARGISGDVKVTERNFSRTGNHWDIFIEGSGEVEIIDISNTGKHSCCIVRVENGEEKETILRPRSSYWDICPICEGDSQ